MRMPEEAKTYLVVGVAFACFILFTHWTVTGSLF